jgi:hypothetical protein
MTTEVKSKINLVNSFIDEAFDIKKISDYHLVIQISTDGVWLTINEKSKNKFIAFESYTFENIYSFDLVPDAFDTLAKESKLVAHRYKSVTGVLVNSLSTIVPSPLFENDKKGTYLKFNTLLEGDEFIGVDDIKNLDAKNVFALPAGLKAKLDRLYNKVNYHHFSSALIEGLLAQNKNQTTKKLFVHIQASHFEAIVIEGKNLLFYNTFNHHTAEDFIYYLLFVCEQLQLNPETIEVVLLGEVERSSEHFAIAQKYIRNLKFGERTDDADYSYQLQTFPKHFHFTLFNNFNVVNR